MEELIGKNNSLKGYINIKMGQKSKAKKTERESNMKERR